MNVARIADDWDRTSEDRCVRKLPQLTTIKHTFRRASEMSDRWSVTVTNVSREYLGVPNDKGFWVSYILLDGNFPDYHGHRLVVAQDELEVYTRFP
jgi:hypothetical protein